MLLMDTMNKQILIEINYKNEMQRSNLKKSRMNIQKNLFAFSFKFMSIY